MMSHAVSTASWEVTAISSLIGACTTEIAASVHVAILCYEKIINAVYISLISLQGIIKLCKANGRMFLFILLCTGPQIFQKSRSHLNILGTRRVT
jgi:hypothetical protein